MNESMKFGELDKSSNLCPQIIFRCGIGTLVICFYTNLRSKVVFDWILRNLIIPASFQIVFACAVSMKSKVWFISCFADFRFFYVFCVLACTVVGFLPFYD